MRRIKVIDTPGVRRLLSMAACIELMESTLAELARGEVEMPVRLVSPTRDGGGVVALMPAHLGGSGRFGYKAVTVFPGNDRATDPTHQAAVAILDAGTGRMLGLVDGTAITEIRTAAVSAVATRRLARPDARILTILGAGAQARAHVAAIAEVRALDEIRMWARDPDRAELVAREESAGSDVAVTAVASAQAALDGADIIVTATSAATPLLERDWIAPGAHINAVGSCFPTTRELDSATVAAARLIVDQRAAAMQEAGDILLAIADGAIGEEHIVAELGEVIIESQPGRTSADEITIFESLGLGAEDVAAAGLVLDLAAEVGDGQQVDL